MYEGEAATIRRLMRDSRSRLIYSNHAERERMVERGISDDDVRAVLRGCEKVTDIRPHKLGPVWSAEGIDLDDRRLRICVSVKERAKGAIIIIVTTIKLNTNRREP